ncbi:MAG: cytochrome c oxidase subunit 3 [Bacteroidota bacterium]|nr:cytochrome c oxidase subunit 3 [Bacteroidota bacterium]
MKNDPILLRSNKAKKMMLWLGMISMSMTFAGLTSAYVVSSSRADWIQQIDLPFDFTISSLIIILSSVTFYLAFKMLKMKNLKITHSLLVITLLLALAFIYFQVQGFNGIIEKGYYFTGPESSITTSYLYILVLLHIAHLVAGIIIVLYVLFNSFKGVYFNGNTLGFELALTFWHFLDILWLYLYLFVSFYG